MLVWQCQPSEAQDYPPDGDYQRVIAALTGNLGINMTKARNEALKGALDLLILKTLD